MGSRIPMLLLAGCLAGSGCATRSSLPSAAQVAAIRERALTSFARAAYLKPIEPNHAAPTAQQFAPLLILEASGTNGLIDAPTGSPRPKVFFHEARSTHDDKSYAQITYWWLYPKASKSPRGEPVAQGVRITLNAVGRPVIWEVLTDTSGAQVIFVSQNLEIKAAQEFGRPLAGRTFAIERPITEAPAIIVARIVDDGPVPMGPMIYVRAATRDIITANCRCMDAQARELAGTQEYELVPDAPPKRFTKTNLDQILRLPHNF